MGLVRHFYFEQSAFVRFTLTSPWTLALLYRYALIFSIGISFISVLVSVYFLQAIRYDTGKSLETEIIEGEDDERETDAEEEISLPFQKVNLTFKDVHYTVKASTSNEHLELLKGIDGYLEAGKMTALMGSSGAGKTTLVSEMSIVSLQVAHKFLLHALFYITLLYNNFEFVILLKMDVLSLRKTSGEITGEVRLNGHLQEPLSFRRCTGYVEQVSEHVTTYGVSARVKDYLTFTTHFIFVVLVPLSLTYRAPSSPSARQWIFQLLSVSKEQTLQSPLRAGQSLSTRHWPCWSSLRFRTCRSGQILLGGFHSSRTSASRLLLS